MRFIAEMWRVSSIFATRGSRHEWASASWNFLPKPFFVRFVVQVPFTGAVTLVDYKKRRPELSPLVTDLTLQCLARTGLRSFQRFDI